MQPHPPLCCMAAHSCIGSVLRVGREKYLEMQCSRPEKNSPRKELTVREIEKWKKRSSFHPRAHSHNRPGIQKRLEFAIYFCQGDFTGWQRAHPHKSPYSVPERALASRQKQPSQQTHSAAAVNNTPRPEFHINGKGNPRAWQQSWRFPVWKFDTFSICNYYSLRLKEAAHMTWHSNSLEIYSYAGAYRFKNLIFFQ